MTDMTDETKGDGMTLVPEVDLEFIIEHIAERADYWREDVLVIPVDSLRELIKSQKDRSHGK